MWLAMLITTALAATFEDVERRKLRILDFVSSCGAINALGMSSVRE